jgi:dihydroorotate dehydrogenase
VMNISRMMEAGGYRANGASLSGIGGVDSGADAAEFILLGSDTVQVRAPAGGRMGEVVCRVRSPLLHLGCTRRGQPGCG